MLIVDQVTVSLLVTVPETRTMPFSGIVEGVRLSMDTTSGESVSARARWARRLTGCFRGGATCCSLRTWACAPGSSLGVPPSSAWPGLASSTGTASAARAALNDNRRGMRRG